MGGTSQRQNVPTPLCFVFSCLCGVLVYHRFIQRQLEQGCSEEYKVIVDIPPGCCCVNRILKDTIDEVFPQHISYACFIL